MPVANNLSTVCILLGDMLTGQQEVHSPGTDFATTTFGVAPLGAYENDYFNQWFGRTFEGTHRNTNFIVKDFVKTNGVVTVEETAAVAYDASDRFFMVPDYPVPELIRAINLAITTVEHEAPSSSTTYRPTSTRSRRYSWSQARQIGIATPTASTRATGR